MAALTPPPDVSVVVVSSGNQPPEQLAAHRVLTEGSRGSRHVIAARSGHWIQFDQPGLIIAIIRELVEQAREADFGRSIGPTGRPA